MNEQLQHRAQVLAYELYDAMPRLPEIDAKTERLEDPVYKSGNSTLTIFNGSVSRSISWHQGNTEYRLWFEVRGMVHFTQGAGDDHLIYQQVIYDEFPSREFRDRPNMFEGDIERFLLEGERIKNAIAQCTRIKTPDSRHSGVDDQLTQIVNIGPNAHERRQVVVKLPHGSLTLERYNELAQTAYRDIPDLPDGVGGFVALADTNAEVQGYNPRHAEVSGLTQLTFRNAAALNFEPIDEENSLAVLAQQGKVTIEGVHLG